MMLSPHRISGPTFSATLTPGTSGSTVGYAIGSLGSISNDLLSDGKRVITWVRNGTTGVLEISGFSSNPGAAYISQATAGIANPTGSASYIYSVPNGVAKWEWAGHPFSFVDSVPLSVSIP